MKKLTCGLSALVCASSSAWALPQLKLGDNAELFLTAATSIRAENNLLLTDKDEISDTVFTVAPGLEFDFGRNSKVSGLFAYNENISRYADNDNLDKELSSLKFKADYDDAKLKLGLNSAFQQLNQNTRDIRGASQVRRDVYNLGATSEVSATEKTSVGAGVSFDRIDFKRAGYVDFEAINVPVNAYYHITPKVDLSGGVRLRETRLDKGIGDSTDTYYNVGARGEFTPKLTGSFSVGYNQRSLDRGGDQSSIGLDSSLKYLVTEKTTVGFNLSNDYGTSADGDSQKTFVAGASVTTEVSAQIEASVAVSYQKIKYYSRRTDAFWDARLGGAYRVNNNIKISASYAFSQNDSNYGYIDTLGRARSGDFKSGVLTISADFRY